MKNNIIKKGFTLAEVLIVLTILGIIAAVSMVTLKPAEFKAKGVKVAAQKALYDIDTATTEILVNDSTMSGDSVIIPASSCTHSGLATLYKKYLTTVNKTASSAYVNGGSTNSICLKSGTCIRFASNASIAARIPGDTSTRTAAYPGCGAIYVDVNDGETPNTLGTDRFLIPISPTGIAY